MREHPWEDEGVPQGPRAAPQGPRAAPQGPRVAPEGSSVALKGPRSAARHVEGVDRIERGGGEDECT